MSPWIPLLVVSVLAAVAGLAVLQVRRRRGNRLQLRVLAGRRRLLGEEIEDRQAALSELPRQDSAALRDAAEAHLDQIHAGLIDREAHLENLDELARLQQHKLAILTRERDEARAPAAGGEGADAVAETAGARVAAAPDVDADAGDDVDLPERREGLEDRLLKQLQQRGDTPKPRPRRRRR